MQKRKLGKSNLQVSAIGSGCMGMIVPIPATTKLHRLEENIGAAVVELTPDDLLDFERAASKINVQGARYPEHIERMSNR